MRLIDADALKHYATGGVTSVGILTLAEINAAPTVDPIHAAGGCYCWECEKNEKGHCLIMRGCSVMQMGFCGYGRRREDA